MLIMKNLGAILPLECLSARLWSGTAAATTCPSWQVASQAAAAQKEERILSRDQRTEELQLGPASGIYQGNTAGDKRQWSYTTQTDATRGGGAAGKSLHWGEDRKGSRARRQQRPFISRAGPRAGWMQK